MRLANNVLTRPIVTMDEQQLQIFENDEFAPTAQLREIKERIRAKYEPRLAAAGRLRRAYLNWRMRHELETELTKVARSIAARL